MKIAIFGATGQTGRRIAAEARWRGHEITELHSRNVDATDARAVVGVLHAHDVGVGATRTPPGQEALAEQITQTLLDAHAATRTRFVMVGGSGSLHPPGEPDRLLADDTRFVPPQYRDLALSGAEQLRLCRAHPDADWTYVAPSAVLAPGERTGRVEIGGDEVLTAPDGSSWVSMEDLAFALLEEIERPRFRRARFTVRTAEENHRP